MGEELSRIERLERWAIALETCPQERLCPFQRVEFLSREARAPARQSNSPLEIAYDDPVLRRAGLESDRFGDGEAFFELSRDQAHRILCSCGYVGEMRSKEVARRIRAVIRRQERWRSVRDQLAALTRWLSGSRPLAGVTRPA
jgi:hypothetical protein